MSNYFDQVAERQLTGAQKSKERTKQKWADKREAKNRPPTALEKKQQDDAVLMKLYRAYRREVKASVVAEHGDDFRTLMNLIRGLEWLQAQKIVDHVKDAVWLRNADEQTKLATLHYVDASLIRSRIRHGLPSFDDGFFDEDPGPFIKIRRLLFGY